MTNIFINFAKTSSILLILCVFACRNEPNKSKNENNETGKIEVFTDTTRSFLKPTTQNSARGKLEEKAINDSLEFTMVLEKALEIAKPHLQKSRFVKKYTTHTKIEKRKVKVRIEMGNLFAANRKHLIVRAKMPWYENQNIYEVKSGELKLLLSKETYCLNFLKDQIFDVNGDGYKDFAINWYASSGCCMRNEFDVYLYNSEIDSFNAPFDFMNPTFSPKEQIIRGVGYGHPGEVALYKYKWKGLKLDTIEYIMPRHEYKGQYIQSNESRYKATEKDGKVLNKVPKEYLKIDGYDWFSAYLRE